MSDGNGVGDFDFFVGSWNSVQRRLVKPLADCDEWSESRATTRCWSVFGGAANVDEVQFPDWGSVSQPPHLDRAIRVPADDD